MAHPQGLPAELVDIWRPDPTPINFNPQRCELCANWWQPGPRLLGRCMPQGRDDGNGRHYHVVTMAEEGVGCSLFIAVLAAKGE